jgi:hypothetical protein
MWFDLCLLLSPPSVQALLKGWGLVEQNECHLWDVSYSKDRRRPSQHRHNLISLCVESDSGERPQIIDTLLYLHHIWHIHSWAHSHNMSHSGAILDVPTAKKQEVGTDSSMLWRIHTIFDTSREWAHWCTCLTQWRSCMSTLPKNKKQTVVHRCFAASPSQLASGERQQMGSTHIKISCGIF